MKIVFMGTPDFAVPCLKVLVDNGYEVAAVVTQPDKPIGRKGSVLAPPDIKKAALELGITRIIQPEKVRTLEFKAELEAIAPDVIVTVAYGKIIPQAVLDIPPMGCINVHGSLLPKYRGAAPIQWAIINGDGVTGITTMYMDTGIDTGDMLLKMEIPISEDMTYLELYDELKELGAKALLETIPRIIFELGITPAEQQHMTALMGKEELDRREHVRMANQAAARKTARHDEKDKKTSNIIELLKNGTSVSEISRITGTSRPTIIKIKKEIA